MFDISFFEILLASVVALLVLGPERLPGAVRTMGLWIGRLKRSFNNIKRDIEKEIGADEIRRQLRNEAIMEKFDSTKNQFTKTIDSVKSQAETIKKDMDLTKQFEAVTGAATKESDTDTAGKLETTEVEPAPLDTATSDSPVSPSSNAETNDEVSPEIKPVEQK